MKIMLTGGAGYIGSHIAVELLNRGHDIIITDNFKNSKPEVINNIKKITGKDFEFHQYDVRDEIAMRVLIGESKPDCIVHLAGLKAVGDSMKAPTYYYAYNLSLMTSLLEEMKAAGCSNLIFSSTATVYKPKCGLKEDDIIAPTNTYAMTKWLQEEMLEDLAKNHDFNVAVLRYFNPIGAHESGLIGEDPQGVPNNLMPYINKVAIGELPQLNVFGDDYDTKDGTGVRDYIHIVDLAKAHVLAIETSKNQKYRVYNIGTGTGYSVMDIIKTYEKVNNVRISYKVVERRPGDMAIFYADPTKIEKELGWSAKLNLEDMCKSSYNFIKTIGGEK